MIWPPTLQVLYLDFFVLLMVPTIPGTIKNNSGNSRHSCFVSDFNQKLLGFPHNTKYWFRGRYLIRLKVSIYSCCIKIFKNQEWNLNFSASVKLIICSPPPAPPCSFNMNNNIDFLILNQPCLPGWFPLGHEKYFILIYHGIGFSI